jgi:hypothetical protein
LQDPSLENILQLKRMDWDSAFFGREFYCLDAQTGIKYEQLHADLEYLDKNGVFGVMCQINIQNIEVIPQLEMLGFRLVDSRMEFVTHTFRGIQNIDAPVGEFRQYESRDWDPLVDLTLTSFVDNSQFKSRYANRNIFSREESLRYFLQWHRWVLSVSPDLFLSWVDRDRYVGFYSILRIPDSDLDRPRYKVGLAAIDPEYRSYNGQNLMQAWLFRETPDPEWTTVNSPQLTNTSGLKNNIRSGKEFKSVELFFFRKNPLDDPRGD